MFEKTFTPEPATVDSLFDWLRSLGLPALQVVCDQGDGAFIIYEMIASHLCLKLLFDNAIAHGASGGTVLATCTHRDGRLTVDISNLPRPDSKEKRHESRLSTNLGLEDVRDICRLRAMVFQASLVAADSRWHAVLDIPADRKPTQAAAMTQGGVVVEKKALPPGTKVMLLDDIGSILKMASVARPYVIALFM